MRCVSTVIIGAGQSGLAFSHELTARSIDHVVLERAEVANSWKAERWDSLRLLTPNWQTRFSDYAYNGPDPDGYMSMKEVASFLKDYAAYCSAPVETNTQVLSVTAADFEYLVKTTNGDWLCQSVVLASGACNKSNIPGIANEFPNSVSNIGLHQYKNPEQLEDGGVLVVGAAASGAQIAKEVQTSGRQVTMSVGEHVRVPRTYRGRDICWWMVATGLMDTPYTEVDDINRARKVASLQLMGSDDRADIDINSLRALGINIVGRLQGLRESQALFSGALKNHCALADLKMNRLLGTIDEWVNERELNSEFDPVHRFHDTKIDANTPLQFDLSSNDIKTVIWATGYKPDYSWLHLPVLDRKGTICHDGGIVSNMSGLYVMGLPFMRKRKSSYIDGASGDAADLAHHLASNLKRKAA